MCLTNPAQNVFPSGSIFRLGNSLSRMTPSTPTSTPTAMSCFPLFPSAYLCSSTSHLLLRCDLSRPSSRAPLPAPSHVPVIHRISITTRAQAPSPTLGNGCVQGHSAARCNARRFFWLSTCPVGKVDFMIRKKGMHGDAWKLQMTKETAAPRWQHNLDMKSCR